MRKIASVLLCLLLVVALAAPAFAADTTVFTITADKTSVKKGDTITFTVSVSGAAECTSLSYAVSIPSQFTLVEGKATMSDAMLKNFNAAKGFVVGFSEATVPSGVVGWFTVTANVDCGNVASVGGAPIVKNGSDILDSSSNSVGISFTGEHSWDEGVVNPAPTCANKGVKTFTCTVCGATNTESIEKLPHNEGEPVVIDPTCTEAGSTTVSCTVCGNEISSTPIAAKGHTAGEWVTVKEATCTDAGEKTQSCTVCKEVIDTETIAAKGHTAGEWVTAKEATCTDVGEKTQSCTVCKEVINTETIAAKGHIPSESSEVIKEATCTEKGLANGVCSVCGAKLDQYETPALGHKYEMTNEVKPTCETEGSMTYVCANDKTHTYTDKVDALGHDYKVTEEVPATCEAAGSKTYVCVNDASHTYTEEIEALGHKWNSGMVTTPATCSTDGEMTYTCLNDSNHTKTEVIPATGDHDYTDKYEQSEDGKTHTGFCACGAEDEPAEHKYTEEGEVTVKPTATTEGEQIMYCVCGAETKVVLPKVDLDDVPKTGDITNQVVLTAVGMFSLIAAAAYVFKRKLAK